jgi:transposase-like protein
VVGDEGEVPDLLAQRRRDKAAAVKLMRKLLKKQGFAPDVLVTDKLRSYGAAKSEIGLSARHEQGLRKNNRLRIRTSRHDGASARCSVSNSPAQPTLLVHSRRRPKHFQRPAPSHIPPHAPHLPRGSFPDVASCDSRMNSNWVVLTSRGQFKFT